MHNYIKKNAEVQCNLEIKALQKSIEIAPQVKEVIRNFDGKVINVKLKNALKEVNKDLRYIHDNFRFAINFRIDEICAKSPVADTYIYINDPEKTICSESVEKAIVEKRICADAICSDIDERIEEKKQRILDIQAQLLEVDKLFEKRDEIIKMINVFNKSLHSTIDCYHRLNISVRS